MNMSESSEKECPLCMETLDWDDLSFFPCSCGYQICRFCWHRLKTDENGLCPACRQAFPDIPVGFNPEISAEELKKQKKRNKDKHRTNKDQVIKPQDLATLRVVQKNLVFVIGLSPRLTQEDLKREFAYFGKIIKFVHNKSTAYITYSKPEEAIRAIRTLTAQATAQENVAQSIQFQQQQQQYINGLTSSSYVLGSGSLFNNFDATSNSNTCINAMAVANPVPRLKASLGTTKYCNHFLRSQQCPKVGECMYLHEIADAEASFTKEQMQAGKHVEYEKRLMDAYLAKFEPNHLQTQSAVTTLVSPTTPSSIVTPITASQHTHPSPPHITNNITTATTTTTTTSSSSFSSTLASNVDLLNKTTNNNTMVAAMAAMMMAQQHQQHQQHQSNSSSPLPPTPTSSVLNSTASSAAPMITLSSSGHNNLPQAAANLFFQSQHQHLQSRQQQQQQTFIPNLNLQMPNSNLNNHLSCNGHSNPPPPPSSKLSPQIIQQQLQQQLQQQQQQQLQQQQQQQQQQHAVSAAVKSQTQSAAASFGGVVADLDSEDDGLDFDPISVSTSGLRDLLLEQQIQQAKQNLHNNLSGINSNINYNSNYFYYN